MSSAPSGAFKKPKVGTAPPEVTGGRNHADTADLLADPDTGSLTAFPTSSAETTAHRAVIQLARLLARQAARDLLTHTPINQGDD